MKKLILAILLAFPAASFAVERLDFSTDIDFTKYAFIDVPLPSEAAVVADDNNADFHPPLKADRASDYYFNSYILKAVEYLKRNYGLKGYNISAVLTHDID